MFFFVNFIIKELKFWKLAQLCIVSVSLVRGFFEGTRENIFHIFWAIVSVADVWLWQECSVRNSSNFMALIYHLQIVLTAKKNSSYEIWQKWLWSFVLKVGNLRRYFQSKWIFGLKIALVETTSVETVLLETKLAESAPLESALEESALVKTTLVEIHKWKLH